MTDEELVAVLMWRGSALQEGAFFAAADRIEQLTAERDKWKTAFDESCNAWQQQCEYEMDRAKKAEAERDRLRAALWDILACETPNANSTVTRMANRARAALKGETP